jgi:DNA topoisomerase-3
MVGDGLRGSRRKRGAKKAGRGRAERKDRGDRKRPRAAARPAAPSSSAPGAAGALFEALRAWRLAEAKRAGVPAFRVMNDRTLLGVASESPMDEGALLRVAGIGPGLSRRYGAAILSIVARFTGR